VKLCPRARGKGACPIAVHGIIVVIAGFDGS
jgi:hypothetical protein